VGLAAGFDKDAQAIEFFSNCGFGAVEVGTVTKVPQVGNPRPRIWRLPEIQSLRNAMGFPNAGCEVIKENILSSKYSTSLGVNIGKNKDTTIVDTPGEYSYLYDYFAPFCDYLVINISSPNTPGLRDLQTKEAFKAICEAVDEKRKLHPKPLYLKIAPDLAREDILDLVELAKEFNLSGIIATNTTIQHDYEKGGLSGKYIKEISKNVRKIVCEAVREVDDLSVIGVGGIDTFDEIHEFWKDGGSFVQVYSSFVFQGPKLLNNFQKDIDQLLRDTQAADLQEYINSIKKSR
jgi:dihydroorotate dehydrogenase